MNAFSYGLLGVKRQAVLLIFPMQSFPIDQIKKEL